MVEVTDRQSRTASLPAAAAPEDAALHARLAGLRVAIDARLEALLPPSDRQDPLCAAARYVVLAPGKRIRPLLALLGTAHFGGVEGRLLDYACALEMVHAASLVLDDLPSMDDAALRRGRPALHVVHGEATAILCAVALLNQAFGVIARCEAIAPAHRLGLVRRLSDAVGFDGLVMGQFRDLNGGTAERSRDGLDSLNDQKTGALFVAAVEGGALAGGAADGALQTAQRFGCHLGRAFQLQDDLADLLGSVEALGKDVGQDASKETLVSVLGIDEARRAVDETVAAALDLLGPEGAQGPLALFTRMIFRA